MLESKLEVATNIAVLCVALFVGVVAVRQYVLTPASSAPPHVKVGQKVVLKDVDWAQKPKTMVLALSNTCHFCSESAPFYQRLMQQVQQHDEVRAMAVLPQPVDDGVAYLKTLQVPITDVRQVNFSSVPIGGTPTILLVNSNGAVDKAWFGKLLPQAEAEVLKEFGCNQSCK